MDTEDQRRMILIILALVIILKVMKNRRIGRKPDTDGTLSGARYVFEVLEGNPAHCREMFRMNKDAFLSLCHYFRREGYLEDSRYISVEEKMAMFRLTLGHNQRNRVVKRRFNHSTHTIHVYFHEVLDAMMKFSTVMIVRTQPNLDQVTQYRRLREIFKGAIGALVGTLIHAVVPPQMQVRYRGRGRGECYQNVLAICDFDMLFTFVWAGWEGTAHDSRVLTETMRDPANGFPIPPPDMYYLCDAAYTHTRGFMAPYRNVRYWLSDFRTGGRPRTKEELFNHAHAQLRNIIERTLGVLKMRFPILKLMAPYSLEVQRDIVVACMALHNFIRRTVITDDFFEEINNSDFINLGANPNIAENLPPTQVGATRHHDQLYMINLREQIANQLLAAQNN